VCWDDIWGDRTVPPSCETQQGLLLGEGCLSFLPISQICEFSKGIIIKELRASDAVVMYNFAHSRYFPPRNKDVGCGPEDGAHGVCAVRPRLLAKWKTFPKLSLRRRWVVKKDKSKLKHVSSPN
jgi:hypothetical protein